MAFNPETDNLTAFEAKATSHTLPLGFLLLYFGLIAWGAYYLWAYSPALGGWEQAQDVEGGGAPLSSNLIATIAFTAIPTAVAIGLAFTQRRRKA